MQESIVGLLALVLLAWAVPAVYYGAPTPCGMLKRKVLREAYGEQLTEAGGGLGGAEILGMGLGAGLIDRMIQGLSPAQCVQVLFRDVGPLSPSSSDREKRYFAAMKADLKNLASQESIYYADTYIYTTSFSEVGFVESEGVEVTIHDADERGWAATATHAALGLLRGCALYYGTVEAPTYPVQPTAPGEIACTR